MDNINRDIINNQAKIKLNILKGFIDEEQLQKAVYADNTQNRKLQRVGKEWGGKKEDDKGGKKTPKDNSPSSEGAFPSKMSHEDIQKHLNSTSTEKLQKFSSDKTRDPKLIEHAKRELEVRSQGEKKESSDSYDNDESKIEENKSESDKKEDEPKLNSKKDFKKGEDFFAAYYEISESESELDWEKYLKDVEEYIQENDLGLDNKNQEKDFNDLSDDHKIILSHLMSKGYDKFNKDEEKNNTNNHKYTPEKKKILMKKRF